MVDGPGAGRLAGTSGANRRGQTAPFGCGRRRRSNRAGCLCATAAVLLLLLCFCCATATDLPLLVLLLLPHCRRCRRSPTCTHSASSCGEWGHSRGAGRVGVCVVVAAGDGHMAPGVIPPPLPRPCTITWRVNSHPPSQPSPTTAFPHILATPTTAPTQTPPRELYTGQQPYRALLSHISKREDRHRALLARVVHEGLRPIFPPGVPQASGGWGDARVCAGVWV